MLFIIWMFDGFVSCAAGSGRCVPCKGSSNSENRKGVGGFLLIFSGGGGGLERKREDGRGLREDWGRAGERAGNGQGEDKRGLREDWERTERGLREDWERIGEALLLGEREALSKYTRGCT
ncbi:MAG: hypothetical protein ACI3X8_01105 [Alloprevotella sp.]